MCDEGYFTAGTTCQKCPDSLALLIPVAIAALIGMGLLLYFLWKVSSVDFKDVGNTEHREEIDEAYETANAGAAVARSLAQISNTAIFSSIALPSIFQISLTFELPFAYVCCCSSKYCSPETLLLQLSADAQYR